MIDGIKTRPYKIDIERLRSNSPLTFASLVDTETGEILSDRRTAKYQGLIFATMGDEVCINGSLHIFRNGGKHNSDDFNYSDLRATIQGMGQQFGLPLSTPLENVEFGVNICVPFRPEEFINSLILHRGKEVNKMNLTGSIGAEFMHGESIIKVYDKGNQYGILGNLLRVEIKGRKMRYFEKKCIPLRTLGDLIDPGILTKLGNELEKTCREFLFCDPEAGGKVTAGDRLFIANGLRPAYWAELKEGKGSKAVEKGKERFREIAKRTGGIDKQLIVANLIREKWGELLSNTGNAGARRGKVTGMRDDQNVRQAGKDTKYSVTFPQDGVRFCPVTGLNIDMQRPGSTFLGTKGIRYYMKNDPETWKKLRGRLSKKWESHPQGVQINEIAHSVRNEYNNPKHNTRRGIENILNPNRGPHLFDPFNFITHEKFEIARWGQNGENRHTQGPV